MIELRFNIRSTFNVIFTSFYFRRSSSFFQQKKKKFYFDYLFILSMNCVVPHCGTLLAFFALSLFISFIRSVALFVWCKKKTNFKWNLLKRLEQKHFLGEKQIFFLLFNLNLIGSDGLRTITTTTKKLGHF